jgi:hypothetical protein
MQDMIVGQGRDAAWEIYSTFRRLLRAAGEKVGVSWVRFQIQAEIEVSTSP